MSKQREALELALEALQNEMRETICKLDPKEMVWIHQPPNMRPILFKEPVNGAVPVCVLPPARKPLTEPELNAIEPTWPCDWKYEEVLAFVRAIERAHGIGEP